ncbi:MAG: nucleotide-binding protein [Desulfobacterales bacterium]
MSKPKVFIGSSSEGIRIAEALFSCLNRDTHPTLWTHQLFLPGQYPLEVLEKQIKRNSFAVLVASPDDELIKRGLHTPAMRDNLLLEFGLFAGALGRRRAFFMCPSRPKIELPSDLFGIVMATYDGDRIKGGADERAAAVQIPCQQISEVINEEWAAIKHREAEMAERLLQSEKSLAVQRLYTVATRLRDALMAVQRDAFGAFSDRQAFEDVKRRAAEETKQIAESFAADARSIGIEKELEELRDATINALVDLPFPQELSLGREAGRQKAINVGIGALDTLLRGGDAIGHVQDAVAHEAGGRLDSLSQRYSEWWEDHGPRLQQATGKMQDALFRVLVDVSRSQFVS